MTTIRNMFSIYIVLVMLAIGIYMVFVQSNNLADVVNMEREGTFVKIAGWFYIAVSIIGLVIITFF